MFKQLMKDYVSAFRLMLDTTWLYGIVVFFVLCNLITKIPAFIGSNMLARSTFGNGILQAGIDPYAHLSAVERLFYAINSISLPGLLSSLNLTGLFSLLALIVAFVIFYKKIRPVRSTPFTRKFSLYSVVILILSVLVGACAQSLFANETLLLVCVVVALVSVCVLTVLLLTIIEASVVALLVSLLSGKPISFELPSGNTALWVRYLFIVNCIIYFVSTHFLTQLISVPQYLHLLIPGIVGDVSQTMLFSFVSNVSWFAYYFHPVFIVVFLFAPITMAIASFSSFSAALKGGAQVFKRDSGYFVLLVVGTVILMAIVLALSNFINPPGVLLTQSLFIQLIHTAIYSLLVVSILTLMYVTAFRHILGVSDK